MKRLDRGFTLIELLVVISIIALLSTLVIATLADAQRRGRNSKRIQEIDAYTKAAELYQTDHNEYPNAGGNWTTPWPNYRCLGRGDSGVCFADGFGGSNTLDSQFSQYMTAISAGMDNGLALGGYAYSCVPLDSADGLPYDPCAQYSILYQLEGTNQQCAGGFVVNPSTTGGQTYCQIIQCAVGSHPVRSGAGNVPYICRP